MTRFRWATAAVLMLAACSSGSKPGGPDADAGGGAAGGGAGSAGQSGGAGGHAGTGGTGGAAATGGGAGTGGDTGAGGAGDQALCDDACTAFLACGVTVQTTCSSDCVAANATYKSCLSAAGTDCNGLAMCYFTATAPTKCPGGGGIPAGTATCAATATCQGTCNADSSAASCTCACVAALSPALASHLLINNSCAGVKCAADCSPSTPSCNSCFDEMCTTAQQDCQSN
jgi:hypothetical protein